VLPNENALVELEEGLNLFLTFKMSSSFWPFQFRFCRYTSAIFFIAKLPRRAGIDVLETML